MDNKKYVSKLTQMDSDFESICLRCGACCGRFDGDPCSNLVHNKDHYECKCYDNRLGAQKTIKGASFTCVSIREHIKNKTLRPECAYNKFAFYKYTR